MARHRLGRSQGRQAAHRRSAFTIFELLILLGGLSLLAGLLLPALGRARASARQIKDSSQIRGIHMGMVVWAQNNRDAYPLASTIDRRAGNETIPGGDDPGIKDQTKNIISILIFNNFFGPEICLSPAEVNPDFAVDEDYEYSEPEAAAMADKKLALWDPAFKGPPQRVDFQGSRGADRGNFSYAHTPPIGARKKMWLNTFSATEAIVGNRGPHWDLAPKGGWVLGADAPVDPMPYPPADTLPGMASNTLLIHGSRKTWEGNIAYNDSHVNFETRPDPESITFRFNSLPKGKEIRFDNLFANENDQTATKDPDSLTNSAGNTNNYLRSYAGGTAKGADMVELVGGWFID